MTDGPLSLHRLVAVVTGAGAGLGRAEAVALARGGASVVVNDVDARAENGVVDEVESLGAKALFVPGDVAERATADAMVAAATEHFGSLHIIVNNAGFTRDRMLFNMTDDEWDAVVGVHLRGHFLLARNAASYWRGRYKVTGEPVYARMINTSSEAALTGSEGQPNYSAAKAGIAAFTVSAARSLRRIGVRANAICPRARTAMTHGVFGPADDSTATDPLSVAHVAPLVAYLAAPAAEGISGQVFVVYGGMVALMGPPTVEARFDRSPGADTSAPSWTGAELDDALGGYFAGRDPDRTFASADVLTLS